MRESKDAILEAGTSNQYRFYTFSSLIFVVLLAGAGTLFMSFSALEEENTYSKIRADMSLLISKIAYNMSQLDSTIMSFHQLEKEEVINEYSERKTTLSALSAELEKLITSNHDEHLGPYVPQFKEAMAEKITSMGALMNKIRHKSSIKASWDDLAAQDIRNQKVLDAVLKNMADIAQKRYEYRQQTSSTYRQLFYIILVASTFASLFAIAYSLLQFRRNQLRSMEESIARNKQAIIQKHIVSISKKLSGDLLVREAADVILNYFIENFDVLAGTLYTRTVGGRIEAISAIGVSTENKVLVSDNLQTTYLNKQGVFQITDVPDDFWQIRSSLGESKPKNLVIMSVYFQGYALGLVELASFSDLSDDIIKVMEAMQESIAIGLSSAQSRTRVQHLLEETQQQSEELQTQQEELKANNEELEQQTRALEVQQQSLHIKNQELEEMQARLREKADHLLKTSQYKSEFLANMSHELRTPLNGLLILSSLLSENKEKNLNEQQLEFVASIHRAGNDLLGLINDILDLSKIEAKKLTMRPEKFNAKEFMEQIEKSFVPQIMNSRLEWKMDIPPGADTIELNTDRQRLEQILRNFIANAIKFTEKGTVTLILEKVGANDLKFSVRDTGIGITEEKQKLIFDAFEQEDTSISRKFGGTGLGLTISKELAVLLGGNISLQSEKGKGSEFSVIVPVQLTAVKTQGPIATSTVPKQQASVEPMYSKLTAKKIDKDELKEKSLKLIQKVPKDQKSILIVEDDVGFSSAVADTVRDYGFYPVAVEDGELALTLLNNFTPDAILLDIKIPGISGLGLLEMIKQLPHLRHVPVHMISGLDYQLSALKMGALGYLTKPVTMEKVKSALERIEHLISGKLRRVLLIEDDKIQRSAITELISGEDVEVVSAINGEQALELIGSKVFDCIIVDLNLPDTSGIDLLERLNSMSVALPPIVIYTAKDLTIEEETQLKKFSESIIVKGARSPERLLDEVNLFLHRIESMLPEEKRMMLQNLRSKDFVFKNKNVLLVDDDLRNVFALTSALETRGMNVRIAKNGKEALDAVESGDPIDVVLMDIMMPVMDGYEAIERIRELNDPVRSKLPIIALTAKAMKEDHEKCIAAGANDYLPKPINLTNLFSVLKVWLPGKDFV